jgi:putative DNA primase/helicase
MALAAQPLADVARDAHLRSPISLNLLVLAESGERKSAADRVFGRAAQAWLLRARAERLPEHKSARAMEAAWRARVDGVTAQIKSAAKRGTEKSGAELDRLQAELVELQQNPIHCPPLPRLFFEDVTPAGLHHDLALGWPSAGLFSDEGGAFLGAHGMGDETATGLLSLLNILWDGRSVTPTRKVAATAELRGRRLSTFLMIQPDLLRKLLEKGGRSLGFVARFLLCRPDSTMGTRFYREPPERWPALERFGQAITRLLEHDLPIDRNGDDEGALMRLKPPPVRLAPDAKREWIEYHDEVEAELRAFGELAEVRDVASKSAENAARCATVFKLFSEGRPGCELEAEYMQAGVAVARWHLDEARRLFMDLHAPQELADARTLLDWILSKAPELSEKDQRPLIDGDGDIAVRSIQRLGPNSVRDSARREAAVRLLEESGHIRRVDRGKQRRIRINPKLRLRG